eukprot:1094457-Pelagomonas_calceolata.AAC.1
MSEKDSRERVKMGQSDGEKKANKPHEPPNCPLQKHWLKDGGLDEHVVLCTLCQSSFQCRA